MSAECGSWSISERRLSLVASTLLQGLSDWLDGCGNSEDRVGWCRNRIVQVRETFGSLNDFEGILGRLEESGHERVKPTGITTYRPGTPATITGNIK